MQRWHLITGLAGAAVLAAIVVPELQQWGSEPAEPFQQVIEPVNVTVTEPIPVQPVTNDLDGILNLAADLDQGALLQGMGEDRYLVVEVSAPELAGDVRRPVHVSVVMDVSGSMAGRGKMDNARIAAAELAELVGPRDSFSLVTFSDRANVRVAQGPVGADALRLIRSIQPGGGTNLYDGITEGFAQLDDSSLQGVKRVVVLSDGMANLGVTNPDTLARFAGSKVGDSISLSALGLGLDYNEDLLAAMSDAGGGRYRFVDQPGQLAQMFSDELQQMTAVAGRQVAVDVDLPQGVQLLEVYGYEAANTAEGYRVYLGDVHGGETRKVVARVKVDASKLGERDIADVELTYADAGSGALARETTEVDATVTPDTRVAAASVNTTARKKAWRARAGELLDKGARDWQKGDVASNQASYEEAAELLGAMGYVDDAQEVQAQQRNYAAAPAASDEGLFQVKQSKEAARGYSY